MGIDGIGGPRPPGTPPGGVASADAVGGPGSVGPVDGTEGTRAVEGPLASEGASRPEALGDVDRARLESGELSVSDYLEMQVQRATAHLVDHAPAATLESIRNELREQLAADPVLRSLAERIAAAAR